MSRAPQKRPGKSDKRQSRRQVWLLLLLTPLLLLGLDSYGWIFPESTPADFPLQGLVPRQLQAHQSLPLSLQIQAPEGAGYQLQILQGPDQLTVPVEVLDKQWRVRLPALAAGPATLVFKPQQPQAPERRVAVQVLASAPQLELSSQRLKPGEQLGLSVSEPPDAPVAAPSPLQVHVFRGGQRLKSWRFAYQPPLLLEHLQLPAEWEAGAYQLRVDPIKGQRLSASFELVAPAKTGAFQLWSASAHLLERQAQPLLLYVTDPQQQPLKAGWVRLLGQTWEVHNGQVEVLLPAGRAASTLAYTLGDAQGNLSQGELHFTLSSRDWLLQPGAKQTLKLSTRQPVQLHWLLKQAGRLWQGQVSFAAGTQPFPLPAELLPGPASLWLQDPSGLSQQFSWQVAAPEVQWPLSPAQPHGLQSLTLSLPPAVTAFEGPLFSRQFVLGEAYAQQSTAAAPKLVALGFRQPAFPPVWASLLWPLLGLGLLFLPVLLLWRPLLANARPKLPKAAYQPLLRWGRGLALALGFVGLLLVPLAAVFSAQSWGQTWLWSAASSITLLLLALSAVFYRLRAELPALSWCLPGVQALYSLLLLWFSAAYQPGLFSALGLAWGLSGLLWGQIFSHWGPRQPLRSQLSARSLLASLTVLALLNSLWLTFKRPELPATAPQQLQTQWLRMQQQAQLLSQTAQTPQSQERQLLVPPAQVSGQTRLQISALGSQGLRQYEQPVRLRPSVLSRVQAPAVAMAGDQLNLSWQLYNATAQAQVVELQLDGRARPALELAPQSQQQLQEALLPLRAGWNRVQLGHRFEGAWYTQQAQIFAQTAEKAQQHPQLHLQIRIPQRQEMLLGEEIPVLVTLKHQFPSARRLGLQLGLPAGFLPVTDTLLELPWIRQVERSDAYLNISTGPLEPEQEMHLHFRMRSTLSGRLQMPPGRLFVLDDPQQRSIGQVLDLWVKPL